MTASLPYTLWFESLPTGDTARLCVRPRENAAQVELYWNRELRSARRFDTVEGAERWGFALHRVLEQDALAGILLGYDDDVLDRLQDQCART